MDPTIDRPIALSKREREVLNLGATGATDQEIGERLAISVPTLRTYWLRIREKIGGVNRTHAIAIAVAGNLAREDPIDPVQKLLRNAREESVAEWAWRPADRHAILDAASKALFGITTEAPSVPLDRMLASVWNPDRPRFERFLAQSAELSPLTPIDLRFGAPGDRGQIVRTVNLSTHRSRKDGVTVLFASAASRTVS